LMTRQTDRRSSTWACAALDPAKLPGRNVVAVTRSLWPKQNEFGVKREPDA